MKITCPESSCRAENDARVEACVSCKTPLRGYVQLLTHPDYLFNSGLAMAREKQFKQARDFFAAVVYWCPMDLEARNALAMACFELNDLAEACRQWERVLEQAPSDGLAKRGLEVLAKQKIGYPAKPAKVKLLAIGLKHKQARPNRSNRG